MTNPNDFIPDNSGPVDLDPSYAEWIELFKRKIAETNCPISIEIRSMSSGRRIDVATELVNKADESEEE